MTKNDISQALDQAHEREEHYRALLLFWKRRRQRLETMIPSDNPLIEFTKGLVDDDDNETI